MKKIHYAWVICAASTLLMICNIGLCSTLVSAYLPYIREAGVSDTAGSMIVSVRSFFALVTMFFVTKYYDHVSLRTGMTLATLLGAVATAVFSAAGTNAMIYYVGAGIAGVAYGLGASIPMSILITRWFVGRRGLALGICASGSGIAAIFFPGAVEALVSRWGLQVMFWCISGFIVLSALLSFLVIRSEPAEMGLEPYTGGPKQVKTKPVQGDNALTTLGWVLLVPMMIMVGSASHSGSGHLSVLIISSGYSSETAALNLSLFGMALTAGKFIYGAVADRIGARWATTAAFSILTVGMLMSWNMDGNVLWPCAATSLMMGLGYPPTTVGVSLWAADFSSPRTYQKTLKWMQILSNIGGIIMGAMPGRFYDTFGHYQGAYTVLAACAVMSVVLMWIVYRCRETAGESVR